MLENVLGWVLTVLLLLLPAWVLLVMLRKQRRLLSPVFAHDARLLGMRLLWGLGDLLFVVPIGYVFFAHDLEPAWLSLYPLVLILLCFFNWFALWTLALLQLFGMMVGVPEGHWPAHPAAHR